jgi:hypothetical protein
MSLSRKDWDKWLLGILSAAVIALCGWIYTTGSRVSALETADKSQIEMLAEIHKDVREIRAWLMDK